MPWKIWTMVVGASLALSVSALGEDFAWPARFFKGYDRTLTGETIAYHSPQPEVKSALLVRSLESKNYIEWATEAVPANFQADSASFIWLFGLDVNERSHKFDLYINGRRCFSFENPRQTGKTTLHLTGTDGAELVLLKTMVDKYDDLMGYAVLTLPRSALRLGEPQLCRVVGESAGSRAWYMTFAAGVEEKLTIRQEPALQRSLAGLSHPVSFQFVHLGGPVAGVIRVGGAMEQTFELEPGFNPVRLCLPQVQRETEMVARVRLGSRPEEEHRFTLRPVRPWTVYLVQHTHTDIGYTRPQSEILSEHVRYLDYALDYCDLTDGYPDDARFRWTCETSWAVREFLDTRPRLQVERLVRRVREGRVEVTGLFLNMSELLDENLWAAQLQPVRRFRQLGIPVTTAMQDDVNGLGWCLVDYLAGIGITKVVMGENADRALAPFDRPTVFWWESPAGQRVLAYRGEHYMKGADLGVIGPDLGGLEKSLLPYLDELAGKGYPYDQASLQFSGYYTDNSPPSTLACELIKQWNEKYASPRLRSATVHEFLDDIQARHTAELPVLRAAWPDWWMDGFGSAALETAAVRSANTELIAHQGLLAAAELLGADVPPSILQRQEEVQDALLFYGEHTFGAAESVSDPLAANSVIQWGQKAAYAWEAAKKGGLLREEAWGLMQPYLPRSEKPGLVVFNSLGWPRCGLVEVYIDHQILPPGRAFHLVDERGEQAPAQAMSSRMDGTYWAIWAKDVPPLGYKIYRIEVSRDSAPCLKPLSSTDTLENGFYRLVIDRGQGMVQSLYDKDLHQELLDPAAPWGLGQFIYERLGNRHQLELYRLDDYTRTPWTDVELSSGTDGPIWQSLTLTGRAAGCADQNGVSCEIRLYKPEKRIELRYAMRKLAVTDPEGVYVAFPFTLPGGQIVFEAPGGRVTPGRDQLPKTSSDWNGVQNFAAVLGGSGQIVLVSPEIPLMQFGAINLGKFQSVAKPDKPHLYSWVLNNYWTTNFRASQEGGLAWGYQLTSSPERGSGLAERFGWGVRVPLLARVLPAGQRDGKPAERSLLNLGAAGVLLVCAKPAQAGGGIILHLREINGRAAEIDVSRVVGKARVRSVQEIDALEGNPRPVRAKLIFKPYEAKFVKLSF